jgi:hypothetical protein
VLQHCEFPDEPSEQDPDASSVNAQNGDQHSVKNGEDDDDDDEGIVFTVPPRVLTDSGE